MSTCCCSLAGTAACYNCSQNPASSQNYVRVVGPDINPPIKFVTVSTPSEVEALTKRVQALEEAITKLIIFLSKERKANKKKGK